MYIRNLVVVLLPSFFCACSPSFVGLEFTQSSLGTVTYSAAPSSPGLLTVEPSEVLGAGTIPSSVHPCEGSFVVEVSPRIDAAILGAEYGDDPDYGVEQVLVVRTMSQVVDGDDVAVNEMETTVTTVQPLVLQVGDDDEAITRVVAGWDGFLSVDGAMELAPQATYTLRVDIELALIHVNPSTNVIEGDAVMDSGRVAISFETGSPGSTCAAWPESYQELSNGTANRVVVNGATQEIHPWIQWRGERPSILFGNIDAKGLGTRLGAVQRALNSHAGIYGQPSTLTASNLRVASEVEWGGGAVLRVEQYVPSSWGDLPLDGGTGRVSRLPDLAGRPPNARRAQGRVGQRRPVVGRALDAISLAWRARWAYLRVRSTT